MQNLKKEKEINLKRDGLSLKVSGVLNFKGVWIFVGTLWMAFSFVGCGKKKNNDQPPPLVSCSLPWISYDLQDGFWYNTSNQRINCAIDAEAVKYPVLVRHNCDSGDADKGYVQRSDGLILYCTNSGCSAEERNKGYYFKRDGDRVECGWETSVEAWQYGLFEYRDINNQ